MIVYTVRREPSQAMSVGSLTPRGRATPMAVQVVGSTWYRHSSTLSLRTQQATPHLDAPATIGSPADKARTTASLLGVSTMYSPIHGKHLYHP